MTITDLQTYLYQYPGSGRISSPTPATTGTPASGPELKDPRLAAYTVEISPEAREISAASMDNRAKGISSSASAATSRASEKRGAGATGATGAVECQTCESRTYQDGSNDSSVSFQSATRIAPGAADSLVRAHEQEHVSHEQVKAKEKGSEVVSQNVSIHYQICPECGRSYVAGGTTKTVTRSVVGSGMGSGASEVDGGKGINVWG
jgi:hypothetical protein